MFGGNRDFLQAVRDSLLVVQMRDSQHRHTDNSVHRGANIVAHGGQKIALRAVRFLGLHKRMLQRAFCVSLSRQHIGDIRLHQADRPVVFVSPQHIDLFIPHPFIRPIRKNEVVPCRLLRQPLEHCFQAKLFLHLFPVRLHAVAHRKAFNLLAIMFHQIRR